MSTIKEYDLLSWAEDDNIKKLINNEKIYYSDFISKISRFGLNQDRIILLTDKNLYYMKNKSINLTIPYEEILGITLSKTTNEFILHIKKEEQDFYLTSKNRNLAISQISKLYNSITKKNLKLCEVDQKNIKHYITSKKEKKKNVSYTNMDEKYLIDTNKFLEKILQLMKKN